MLKQEVEGPRESRQGRHALLDRSIALTEGSTVDLDAEIKGDVSI